LVGGKRPRSVEEGRRSGKSTPGRCILGLERPAHGSVRFEGMEVSALKGKALARIRPGMRLFDSVTEPPAFHRKRKREEA